MYQLILATTNLREQGRRVSRLLFEGLIVPLLICQALKDWKPPYSKEEIEIRFKDPNRKKYQYWVSDNSLQSRGYFKIINDPSEAPQGVKVQEVICIG